MKAFREIDLNLLPIMGKLIETKSVSKTAFALNMSSPAVSRALARLRVALADELLVRSGQELTLTPRALSLQNNISEILELAEELVAPVGQPDMSIVKSHFRIRCDDAFAGLLSATILPVFSEQAPNLSIEILGDSTFEGGGRTGVHMELGGRKYFSPETVTKSIGKGVMVVVVSASHPLVDDPSLLNFLKYPHVLAKVQLDYEPEVRNALKTSGQSREVKYTVPGFFAAAAAASNSTLIATMPSPIAAYLASILAVKVLPVPVVLPEVPVSVAWHVKYRNDLIHKWVRDKIYSLMTENISSTLDFNR